MYRVKTRAFAAIAWLSIAAGGGAYGTQARSSFKSRAIGAAFIEHRSSLTRVHCVWHAYLARLAMARDVAAAWRGDNTRDMRSMRTRQRRCALPWRSYEAMEEGEKEEG